MTEQRYTVEEGNDSEFRIRDGDAERFDASGSDVGWDHVHYVASRESDQPWHHWIKEIADAYCAALNRGEA